MRLTIKLLLATLFGAITAQAQVPPPTDSNSLSKVYPGATYSPYAGRGFATDVYWGDTHLHTDMSMDAGAFGNRLDLDDAYRFARGEEINSTSAGPVRLSRPLDFLVVADHSDNMGFFPDLLGGAPHILSPAAAFALQLRCLHWLRYHRSPWCSS